MATITVKRGPIGAYYHFEPPIFKRHREGRTDWMYLLPVNRAVRIFKHKLIDAYPEITHPDPPVFTFDNLLKNIYGYLPQALRLVPASSMPFLIEEALRIQSKYFQFFPGDAASQSGLIRKIAGLIDELHRFGYNAANFSTGSIAEQKIPADKYADLLCVMQQLDALFAGNYIDAASAAHQAGLQVTPELFRQLWPEVETIYINGYGVFTPGMFAFMQKISTEINVVVKLEYVVSNPTPFESVRKPLEIFKKMGARIIDLEAKSVLAGHLFNRENPVPKPLDDKRISLLSCTDRSMELEQITLKIRELHEDQHIALHKIAITFPNLDSHAVALREVFQKHDVPINLSTGYPLQRAPLIETFTGLLETILQNFDYARVINLYHTPFFEAERPAIGLLHKAIIAQKIRRLTAGWDKKIRGTRSDELQKQIDALVTFLTPVYNFGHFGRTGPEYYRDIILLLKKCGALGWYRSPAGHSERQKEKEFRAYNAFMKMLEPFFWSLDLLYKNTAISLTDFLKRLKAAIAQVSFSLTEWPQGGVQIMPRLEIQAIEYDVLFLGGLVDGQLPRAAVKDIFLDDALRDELGLTASEELLDQDRFLFLLLLDAPAQHIYLSNPAHEGGKALVPSTFIDELRNCLVLEDEMPREDVTTRQRLWEDFGTVLQKGEKESALEIISLLNRFPDESTEQIQQTLKNIKAVYNRADIHHNADVYEGDFSESAEIRSRLTRQYTGHLWSVSQLEEYAFCPMQFFLNRTLRLEKWPEFETDINPLDRGNALHKTLFRFFRYLKQNGACREPAKHIDTLKQIAQEEFDLLPLSGFFWELEKEHYLGNAEGPGLLVLFVEIEQQAIDATGFVPTYFEFSFGNTNRLDVDIASVDTPLVLHQAGFELSLSGKIDRIDVNPHKQALVFDYKTGSVPGAKKYINESINGSRFQLAVYLIALQNFFGDLLPVYAGLYQIKDENNLTRKPMMTRSEFQNRLATKISGALLPNKNHLDKNGSPVSLDDLLEIATSSVFTRYHQLVSGNFQHSAQPDDVRCAQYCDFRRICQKQTHKQKAQRREGL